MSAKIKASRQQGFDDGVKSANDACTARIGGRFLKGAEITENRVITDFGNEDGKFPFKCWLKRCPKRMLIG
jgi:hypothetical protein